MQQRATPPAVRFMRQRQRPNLAGQQPQRRRMLREQQQRTLQQRVLQWLPQRRCRACCWRLQLQQATT
jgi:hypothetical protein